MIIDKSKLSFRNSTEKDWKRIIEIYNQAVDEVGKTADMEFQTVEGREHWLKQHLNSKYPILLAELDNEIIGWCSLSPHRPGRKALEKTAEISYYLDKKYRKMGIGTLLINSAIETAQSLGIKNLFAILLDINQGSVIILEKFGFKRWGHLPKVAQIDDIICGQYIYGRRI